jgi:Na+-transporting NADH:ubiquinone oxidoreductase subunit A
MGLHQSRKGLDLPISGAPDQTSTEGAPVPRVAIIADDFPGMKPRFIVKEGENVLRGQPIFEDRKLPGVFHTAPGAGVISAIHRGQRRALQSVVIELSEGELSGAPEHQTFAAFEPARPRELTAERVRALLLESGAWTHLRTRPFGHTPAADAKPAAIFVNGLDTNPLAARPEVAAAGKEKELDAGLWALTKLCDGPTFFCVAPNSILKDGVTAPVQVEEFSGPHPAGTVGFHIHTLLPAHRGRVVFSTTYPEVIAIGHLILTGKISVDRVVALGGPAVKNPRLLATRTGADIAALTEGQLNTRDPVRAISGSVLSGVAASATPFAFLGRRSTQISVLREAGERRLLGWLAFGFSQFSILPTFASKFSGKKSFDFTTDTNGSARAMVPIGMYEKVNAWDILPTHLLRALLVGDVEMAEKLGALELDEEDVALFSFVCPGKTNFGLVLRSNLERMFAEG